MSVVFDAVLASGTAVELRMRSQKIAMSMMDRPCTRHVQAQLEDGQITRLRDGKNMRASRPSLTF